MNRISNSVRRLANACFGAGPWRIAPFAAIAAARTDEGLHGVHRAESFADVVHQETEAARHYPAAVSLLAQSSNGEMFADGPRYLASGICPAVTKNLFTLTDAAIVGRDGVVYCPRQRIAAAETVRCWTVPALEHPLLSAWRYPPAQNLPGLSLSLVTLDAEGFYHFLIEALPRLWLARAHLTSIDHFLVNGPRQPTHCAWLAQAGIPEEKIIWLEGHSHFRCEQLLFASQPLREHQPTPWLRDALGQLLRAPRPATGKSWLWISRVDARSRHLAWEDEFLAQFPRFEKITLSARPPAEQIARFADAAVVAGPHGAGLANLVFAAPGVRLVEFFPDRRTRPIYARLAQAAGGRAAWAATDFTQPADREKLTAAVARFLAD